MVQSARSRAVLTLYTTPDDIQCHRVRLLLAAKGVSYERVMVEPGKPPEDLVDLNPYASTPTLVDRDLTLYDTAVVCEYLDERYPHPPLMPIDPLSRARLRLAAVRIERDGLPEVDVIRVGGENRSYAVSEGFIEVSADRVTVLAESAEPAGEIDVERARKALAEAQAKMKGLDSNLPEYQQESARARRAQARVSVGSRR